MALLGLYKIKRNNEIKNFQTNPKLKWTRITNRKSCQSFCWLYEGQMMNDKHHGYGLLTKVNQHGVKKKCYAGHWINGKFEGLGEYWYDNGDYYEGNFHNGKKSRFGRMWYNDGSFYQGFWKKDLYNDKGMIIYENGNRYEGNFVNGKKDGFGIFYHFKTGQKQEGHWISDICKESVIIDIVNRQSASKPTPYSIPILR
ncbi:hypothetical protein PV328_009827 [Microctonus aethiopoides]|uniref:MORN repeat-containing protein 3 n=1 Tax=Microctonus aethiopoides TaxID=144406 RepID=A0AA39C6R8_9HYME|nr:hypothetical protein PV328_009827 [Microctonus aethiopoides]